MFIYRDVPGKITKFFTEEGSFISWGMAASCCFAPEGGCEGVKCQEVALFPADILNSDCLLCLGSVFVPPVMIGLQKIQWPIFGKSSKFWHPCLNFQTTLRGKNKKSTWKFQAESIYLFFELYFWFSIGLQPEDALKLENKGGKGIFLKITFLLRLVQKFQKDLACFLLYMQTMQQKPISEELPPHDIVYTIATLQSKTWNFQSRKNELFLC